MNRRDFLLAASATAGGTVAATGTAAAQGGSGGGAKSGAKKGGKKSGGKAASGGTTKTVQVGPGGDFVFTPGTEEPLYVTPGTKVKFVWKSDGHNIAVGSQPKGANWKGHEPIENTGFTSSYTFQKKGKYHYWCDPHKSLGMIADIVVNSTGQAPGGGGGEEEVDPEEMGVPFQAHYVGIATLLMMVVSLVYTFFLVKYGESPNAKGGN
ncbi:MAG TPA: plastocyanin/azurin family copper-binding protein [Halococcus sp.]|nr:plastocyanin/azurin family copper-binding protein [Halococcus sp.]